MNLQHRTRTLLIAAFLLPVAHALAQVPPLINYQGQLTDAAGNPANGTLPIRFSIYASATGGSVLYSEIQNVAVSNGVFNVLLGSVNPIPLNLFDSGTERYLEITVDDETLTPRRRFGSVPYAFATRGGGNGDITAVAAGAGLTGGGETGEVTLAVATNGVNSAMIQDNTIVNADINVNAAIAGNKVNPNFAAQNILTTGSVGIGITNPSGPLHILKAAAPPSALPPGENGLLLGMQNTAGYKWIQSYGGVLAINPQGNNVGIGTNSPTQALEVAGNVRALGFTQSGNGGETLRIIRGNVNAGGFAVAGTGFTSSRTGTGTYSVSFLSSFGAQPAVIASPNSTLAAIATVDATTSSSFVVRMFDSNGAALDRGFSFLAVGIP